MDAGETARLQNLCRIFKVDSDSTQSNPAAAFTTMSMLYAMPAISDHAKRRDHGNKILQSTQPYFMPSDGPSAARFFSYVQGLVIEIQEFPGWFTELSLTPEELVSEYRRLSWASFALKFLGASGLGTSAIGAAIKEGIKNPKSAGWKAALKTAATRSAGQGPIIEGFLARYATVAADLQPAILLLVVTATAMNAAIEDQMQRIKLILLDRLQSGQISNELYSQVVKETVPPSDIKRYWEMK